MAEKKERPVQNKKTNEKEIRHGSQPPNILKEGLDFSNTLKNMTEYFSASPYEDDDYGKKSKTKDK